MATDRTLRITLVALLLAAAAPYAMRPAAAAEAAEQTFQCRRDAVQQERELRLFGRQLDRSLLLRVYGSRDFQPIWIDHPEREKALLQAFAVAADHGLDPEIFAIPEAGPLERELLLTDGFLRYAMALARGRVSPAEIEADWAIAAPSLDAVAALDQALAGDLGITLASLAPGRPDYVRLQQALVRYRGFAAAGGWPVLGDVTPMKRGDKGEPVQLLRRRLIAEEYLAATAAEGDYDEKLEAAVRRFQATHGIAVDGQVGRGTLAALDVPVAARLEQIRVNLERWRTLPRDWPATRLEVNAPSATLVVLEKGDPILSMRVVVGAVDHQTPVLQARMNAILINPPWNVPVSIARKELLPKYKRDPGYFERNHYVFVGREGLPNVQQLPGPGNALGSLKFEIPNVFDVYLHDTPTRFFTRSARALSHGCVRVEQPRELARYVLSPQPGWEVQDIDQAIAAGVTRRVSLARTLPVYILYWTAYVDPDGKMQFRDDIYGRDLRLSDALVKRDSMDKIATSEGTVFPENCFR